MRFGDAWHPYRFSLDWLREDSLPKLRHIADTEERPTPAFCPRLSLRLTNAPLPEERRRPGHGSLDQVQADLEALDLLGAEYVLLDTYVGGQTRSDYPDSHLEMLAKVADVVLK